MFKIFALHEDVRLQLYGEAFNVFGNVNLNNPTALLTSPSVGVISGSGAPRILEFAAKVLF